ncbi:MAG: NAD(P)H-hydrate dehydratase [Bacillota bacterium]
MKVVTAAEMRRIDQEAVNSFLIPALILMENAGAAVCQYIAGEYPDIRLLDAVVVAGKGNNGGDGLVAARRLFLNGAGVKVFITGGKEGLSAEAAANAGIAERLGIHLVFMQRKEDLQLLQAALSQSDLAIDAIFGTGFSGPPKGIAAEAVKYINLYAKKVLAVDIPSGVSADTGRTEGEAVKADVTIALGLPKIGNVTFPGAELCGELQVMDIGFPPLLTASEKLRTELLDEPDAGKLLPRFPRDIHKGRRGHVLVLGGSPGMNGAPLLAAMGALKAGAGLVTAAVPESIYPYVAGKAREIMTISLPQGQSGAVHPGALDVLADKWERWSAAAVGPGMSQAPEAAEFMTGFWEKCPLPLVADADALNIISRSPEKFFPVSREVILTPHPGELARLSGLSIDDIQGDRVRIARALAEKWHAVLVLKGARTVIAGPSGDVRINTTGNPGMASGGMGDVLAGVICALVAQGAAPEQAAAAGSYLHGLAADLAARGGEIGITARDVLFYLPRARKAVEDHARHRK